MGKLPESAEAGAPETSSPELSDRFVRLATLIFWFPCLALDIFMLWRWGANEATFSFVFSALFRECLVFLAIWLVVGGARAMVFGRRSPQPRRRPVRRRVDNETTVLTTTREHRGR